jgi:hypothetical protein
MTKPIAATAQMIMLAVTPSDIFSLVASARFCAMVRRLGFFFRLNNGMLKNEPDFFFRRANFRPNFNH